MKTMPVPFHQIDDHQLVRQAAEGSREAFGELVSRHHFQVRAMLWRVLGDETEVDDLAQEVFMSALSKVNEFRQQAAFSTWLLAIARNKAISHLRRKTTAAGKTMNGLDQYLHQLQIEQLTDHQPEPPHFDALRGCLKQLSEKHQQLIQAVYFQERNTAELAQEMGQARNAIRMRLMRIRRALAGCIQRQMRD